MKRPSKKMISFSLCIPLAMMLSGCQKYYLSLTDQDINVNYLASTHVATPDKRQQNPPYGQMIVMDWRVPKDVLAKKPTIDLYVIYGNYTEEKFKYPICKKMGYVTYKDLNEDFVDKKGIIAYRAEISLEDGTIYKSWKHQLWAELITIDDSQNPLDEQRDNIALLKQDYLADQQNGINLANESAEEGEIPEDKNSSDAHRKMPSEDTSKDTASPSPTKKLVVDEEDGINLSTESTDENYTPDLHESKEKIDSSDSKIQSQDRDSSTKSKIQGVDEETSGKGKIDS